MPSLYYSVLIRGEFFPKEGEFAISQRMSKETAQKALEMTREIAVKYVPLGSGPITLSIVPADPSWPLLTLMELEDLWNQWKKEESEEETPDEGGECLTIKTEGDPECR
jgi:hypothetical protein